MHICIRPGFTPTVLSSLKLLPLLPLVSEHQLSFPTTHTYLPYSDLTLALPGSSAPSPQDVFESFTKSKHGAFLSKYITSTVNSRYKYTVGTRGNMLIANICLYQEKITPCYIYGGATRGMVITRVDCNDILSYEPKDCKYSWECHLAYSTASLKTQILFLRLLLP